MIKRFAMKIILGISLFLVCVSAASAQETELTAVPPEADTLSVLLPADTLSTAPKPDIFEALRQEDPAGGHVNIIGKPGINELIELHTAINKDNTYTTVYRIQIFSGNSYDHSIEELQAMKENFEIAFPDIPAYLKYFEPDFKIRVGNFRNRLDCIPALKKIRKTYPSCYPVKTKIPLSDLEKPAQIDNQIPENIEEAAGEENIDEEEKMQ